MSIHRSKDITGCMLAMAALAFFLALFYALPWIFNSSQLSNWSIWCFVCAVLILALTWPSYYELNQQAMVLRMGFIKLRFPIHTITRVTKGRGFTRSSQGLLVFYKKRTSENCVFVSPEDSQAFCSDLLRVAPGLRMIDGEIRREEH